MVTHTISLLIVEDQDIVMQALKRVFTQDPDFDIVATASDGQAAVDAAVRLKPDVVIMDIGLPLLDGIDATRAIKAASPQTKVLVLTAYENDDFIFGALSAGADGYCMKTTPLRELTAAAKTIAGGAGWLDPRIAQRVFANVRQPNLHAENKYGLSARESEVLALLVQSASNKEIAAKLCISVDTVKTHVRKIFEKLMVADRTQAALKALDERL